MREYWKEISSNINLYPLFVTAALMAWTLVLSPFTEYGDAWAAYATLAFFPAVVCAHLFLLAKNYRDLKKLGLLLLYAAVHITVFFFIWICAMIMITKDSI